MRLEKKWKCIWCEQNMNKNEKWSAQIARIVTQAVREAQAKNRELGIVNWYSLNSVIVNDAAHQEAEKAKDKTQ